MNKAVELSKWAVALAAALVAGSASAYSFTGGGITLNGSQEAASIGDLYNWVITVPTGSASTAGLTPSSDPNAYPTLWVTQPLTAATFAADGSVTDVLAAGSSLKIAKGASFSTFSNFEVDFTHGQILADVTTQSGVLGRQAIFDVTGLNNTTTVNPDGSISVNLAAASVVVPVPPAGKVWAWWSNIAPSDPGPQTSIIPFGSLSGNVTAAVPEPSTYVLMALGLGGVGVVARRRRAA